MFEVVVIVGLLIEHVHNHVTVIERDPLSRDPTFDVLGLHAERQINESLDLFGNGSNLTICSSSGDDEGVEGINELS